MSKQVSPSKELRAEYERLLRRWLLSWTKGQRLQGSEDRMHELWFYLLSEEDKDHLRTDSMSFTEKVTAPLLRRVERVMEKKGAKKK